jgi:hypothetical protein
MGITNVGRLMTIGLDYCRVVRSFIACAVGFAVLLISAGDDTIVSTSMTRRDVAAACAVCRNFSSCLERKRSDRQLYCTVLTEI